MSLPTRPAPSPLHSPVRLALTWFAWLQGTLLQGKWLRCAGHCLTLALLATVQLTGQRTARAEALPRMRVEHLRATRQSVLDLAGQRQPVALDTGYQDVRATMHVHSRLSHDSRSSPEEVAAGAKAAGVQVVLFNEHPASHYDFVRDGNQGVVDGVLFMPGAEMGGFLAYPQRSLDSLEATSPQALADRVLGAEGMVFLSHLEERLDWQITGLTGTEIYNTHADFKDEAKLAGMLRNPLTLLSLQNSLRDFPQEMYSALLDYPADYLRRYDELCQIAPHTGVAANDAHHNIAARALLTDSGKIRVEDALGTVVAELDPEKIALLKTLAAGKQPGDILFALDLDPYERSLHHVSTHLWLKQIAPADVYEALRAGRAYVAFDWLADPTGFAWLAESAAAVHPSGSQIPMESGLQLRVATPLVGFIRLIRDGVEIKTAMGRQLDILVEQPGVYRVEVWLQIAGERRPWILSNPIYIRAAAKDS